MCAPSLPIISSQQSSLPFSLTQGQGSYSEGTGFWEKKELLTEPSFAPEKVPINVQSSCRNDWYAYRGVVPSEGLFFQLRTTFTMSPLLLPALLDVSLNAPHPSPLSHGLIYQILPTSSSLAPCLWHYLVGSSACRCQKPAEINSGNILWVPIVHNTTCHGTLDHEGPKDRKSLGYHKWLIPGGLVAAVVSIYTVADIAFNYV